MKRTVKHIVDALMILFLPILMAEVLTGRTLHEWLGAAMMVLFAAHHALNIGWYKNIFKGKYTPVRCFGAVVGWLLLADILALAVSGIWMSDVVFRFLPIGGGLIWSRRLHLFASHWGLILMSAHLGLHWEMMSGAFRKMFHLKEKNKNRTLILWIIALAISFYGILAFFHQQMPDYLLLKAHFVFFDEQKSAALHFADYIAIIVLFAAVGYHLNKLLRKTKIAHTVWKATSFLAPLTACIVVVAVLAGAGNANPSWEAPVQSTEMQESEPSQNAAQPPSVQPDSDVSIHDGFVLISGGAFKMGSPESEAWRSNDETLHTVSVSDFYISPYELTQKEYTDLMGTNPSSFNGEDLPVENITWIDAITYCNTRSSAEGLTPAYVVDGDSVTWNRSANGYRLPTEAEWEYACRAGTGTPFNTETSISPEESNYYGHYPYQIEENYFSQGNLATKPGQYRQTTVAADSFSPNGWGLYNMHGNVSEWVWDTYGAYDENAKADPTGPVTGTRKVYRGGGWNDFAKNMRSAYRAALEQDAASFNLGMRLVRNAAPGVGMVTSNQAERKNHNDGNILIAYFSWGGNTRGVAQEIQRQTGADIFEITLVEPYSTDYNTVLEQAQHDQNIQARPEIANLPDSIDSYDIVMIGYPNWWASIPMPVASFLEAYDFSDKTILPFCSHGGGRFGQSLTAIAKLAPDSTIKEGLAVTYSSYDSAGIQVWLADNGIAVK